MLRLLLLTILSGVLLAMFCGVPQQPLFADGTGMQPGIPKPLHIEASPAMLPPAPSQFQTAHAPGHGAERLILPSDHRAARLSLPTPHALRDSVQSSTILRI